MGECWVYICVVNQIDKFSFLYIITVFVSFLSKYSFYRIFILPKFTLPCCTFSTRMLRIFGIMPHIFGTIPHIFATMLHSFGTMPHSFGTMPHFFGTMPHILGTMPHMFGTMLLIFLSQYFYRNMLMGLFYCDNFIAIFL